MKIIYFFLYALLWTLAWLPLCVHYLFADFAYIIVYYIARYRRKVVRKNLRNSFPEKSEKEIKEIEKKFYLHFCDIFVETVHLLHISEKEMKERMKFTNYDLFNEYIHKGRNIMLMLGHYGNWEYMVGVNLVLDKNENFISAGVYRKINNKAFNELFLKFRTLFGIVEIEKKQLFREVYKYNKHGQRISFAIMADQTPSPRNIHYWTNFLNQDTPVLTGGERIARKLDFVLIYVDITKVKRGYYEATMKLIDDNVPQSAEFADTERYARMMEETILREPAYWLWTHKRWKHKREQ